jgi:hypothetical protein
LWSKPMMAVSALATRNPHWVICIVLKASSRRHGSVSGLKSDIELMIYESLFRVVRT